MKALRVGTLVLSLAAASGGAADEVSPADIWQSKCKGCHGPDGRADTKIGHKEKIPDFASQKFQGHTTDDEIRAVINRGSKRNKKMKAYKDKLSQAEIDSLVQYIRGFSSGSR